jgi:hypothetical protein
MQRVWEIESLPPTEFGQYILTTEGLLLVDRVIHAADMAIIEVLIASEESQTWASGLLAATGATSYRLVEIQQSG